MLTDRELMLAKAALGKVVAQPATVEKSTRRAYGSLPTGVFPSGSGFKVVFTRGSVQHRLGQFPTFEQAAAAAAAFERDNPPCLKRIPWSDAEIGVLRANAGKRTARQIGRLVGRTIHSVYRCAKKLNISLEP